MADEKKPEAKPGSTAAGGKGNVKIAFSSAGKDFHLEVRGEGLDECEKAFERLFERVRTSAHKAGENHYG